MNDDNPEVDVSIAELVLHGVPSSGRAPLEQAFRRELGRLLAADPLRGVSGGRVDLRRPIDLRVARGNSSKQLGHQLAHAVHGALRRS